MNQMVVVELQPEEAERVGAEIKELLSWIDGFETGRGSSLGLPVASIRRFSNRLKDRNVFKLVANDQF